MNSINSSNQNAPSQTLADSLRDPGRNDSVPGETAGYLADSDSTAFMLAYDPDDAQPPGVYARSSRRMQPNAGGRFAETAAMPWSSSQDNGRGSARVGMEGLQDAGQPSDEEQLSEAAAADLHRASSGKAVTFARVGTRLLLSPSCHMLFA